MIAAFGVCVVVAVHYLSPQYLKQFTVDGGFAQSTYYRLNLLRAFMSLAGILFLLLAVAGRIGVVAPTAPEETPSRGDAAALFAVSFLILFMELAFIRWIPAYVKLASYFTNFIMLSAFLGMGLGCIAPASRARFMRITPLMIAGTVIVALFIYILTNLNVISYAFSQGGGQIFFGSELRHTDMKFNRYVGVSLIIGLMLLCVTFTFIGPGQLMGRLFGRIGNPIRAYTINVGASIAGIAVFSLLAFLGAPAWVWFIIIAVLLLALMKGEGGTSLVIQAGMLLIAISCVFIVNRPSKVGVTYWSPYYKIYREGPSILANEIGHQGMESVKDNYFAPYNLPHLLRRDSGFGPFRDALIIGAGSGNDVSFALAYGVKHIDAVEIDPVILGIGKRLHADKPYSSPNVRVITDDGRSYLRRTDKKYDVIIYALVDSLTLMSNFSSVRLENYLFTQEAFADIHRRLKPDGVFVIYNFFRENWLTLRMYDMLFKEFHQKPLLIMLPPRRELSDSRSRAAFSIFMVGDIEPIRAAMEKNNGYTVNWKKSIQPQNGFENTRVDNPLTITITGAPLDTTRYLPRDDWPFVYLHNPSLPRQNLWGLVVLGAASLVLIAVFIGPAGMPKLSLHYFFLGGAFMLLETRNIVKLALIHGSTWFVNSITFAAVLLMIFLANLYVAKRPIRRGRVVYLLLFVSIAVSYVLPVESFLGKSWYVENGLSAIVLFAPIAFAGVIFANSFRRSRRPSQDLGANLLGVIIGGISEYSSLAWGYNNLLILAAAMYLASMIAFPRDEG